MFRFFSVIDFKENFLIKIYANEYPYKKELENKIKEICSQECFKPFYEHQKSIYIQKKNVHLFFYTNKNMLISILALNDKKISEIKVFEIIKNINKRIENSGSMEIETDLQLHQFIYHDIQSDTSFQTPFIKRHSLNSIEQLKSSLTTNTQTSQSLNISPKEYNSNYQPSLTIFESIEQPIVEQNTFRYDYKNKRENIHCFFTYVFVLFTMIFLFKSNV